MKLNLELRCESPQAWIEAVMDNFPAFLQDHADCERKASAMAMSFVAKYPDRREIIPELIDIGIEELEHFKQVYALMEHMNVPLPDKMYPDPYIDALLQYCRTGREQRFLDRLLIASVVETRGAERFRLVSEHQAEPELTRFYKILYASEAKHGHTFIKMALHYFGKDEVYARADEWHEYEAEVIRSLPIRAALH